MRYLFAFLLAGLLHASPALAQLGNEMKSFRDREGVTVTLLTPSLFSLYQKDNLGKLPGEVLKQLKEVNVLRVDKQRAAPALKEEIARRVNPVLENESRFALVSSQRARGNEERVHVSRQGEEITALALWSENERELVVIELRGIIALDKARALPAVLQVRGLERLAYLVSPDEELFLPGSPFDPGFFSRGNRQRVFPDTLFPGGLFDDLDPFSGFDNLDWFDNAGSMMESMERLFEEMRNENTPNGLSTARGIEVTRSNGKTRIKVNASNAEIFYLIDGQAFTADSLPALPEDIATVDMIESPNDHRKAFVVINTTRAAGQFVALSNGLLRFRHENQDYAFHLEMLPPPVLLINNIPTKTFNINPSDILQIRPASQLERDLFNTPTIQVIIITR
ncbi:MAG: DUF4252 domain-containing protein [Odoribacteraceae bacterium]|jgi:hypothetical protein|nr:DUF4252 domain-containing protein [Odoribacteraceae bacterium]